MSQTPACPDVPDADRLAKILRRFEDDVPPCKKRLWDEDASVLINALRFLLADRASRALPSTALAARPEEGWQIKPLEWKPYRSSEGGLVYEGNNAKRLYVARALHPFGVYFLMEKEGRYSINSALMDDTEYWSEVRAKAAAQIDYETRIRSALVAPSTPPTAGDGHD